MAVVSRPIRILIVADEQVKQGMEAVLASSKTAFIIENVRTLEEFREHIKRHFYHIYILHDSIGVSILKYLDENNLLKIAIIYIFNQSDWEDYRNRFNSYDPHIYKNISPKTMTEARIVSILTEPFNQDEIAVNLGLEIELIADSEKVLSFDEAARQIMATMRLNETLKLSEASLITEFEELLCRIFSNCNKVRLELIGSGFSGASVLRVQPFRIVPEGQIKAAPGILKFGLFNELDKERKNWEMYVEGILRMGLAPRIQKYDHTQRLGAVLYELVGSSDRNPFIDLAVAYHHYDIEKLKPILFSVFNDTCDGWYNIDEKVYPVDLTEDYRVKSRLTNLDRLINRIDALPNIDYNEQEIHFQELSLSLPNPLTALNERIFVRDTYRCVTHGDLHVHNILLNEAGVSWLIDFADAGYAHILRDVASLEVSIRIYLLHDTAATLTERYELEKALMKGRKFLDFKDAQPPSNLSPALQKTYQCVCVLREIAHGLVKNNPANHLHEYYISLFYLTMRALKYSNLSELQHKQVLLSSAMIIDQL